VCQQSSCGTLRAVAIDRALKAQLAAAADKTKETIDSAREPIADQLLGAADTLRTRGERLPRGTAGIAQGAADRLETSATYLVSNTVPQMMEDVLSLVRKNPAQSLLIAGALGFLLGRALRHR
jgi:ElaB/YqjD/DUF883 family membrane-anchored ribosome-binding protein